MKFKTLIFFIFLFIIQQSVANSINLVEVFDDYDVIKKDDSTADNITVCLKYFWNYLSKVKNENIVLL